MPALVLFDIDGTVLTFDGTPPGPGRLAMAAASHELFGGAYHEGLRFSGRTDRWLADQLMERAGIPVERRPAMFDTLIASYTRHLGQLLTTRRYRPIGDVAACMQSLRARGHTVGLATGNLREGARLKLRSAGIEQAFDFEIGGYGCDHQVRAEIVRAAIRRDEARSGGASNAGRSVVVVGDTVFDWEAAREVRARFVGVTIDAASAAELAECGARFVVDACGPGLVEAIEAALAEPPQ